MLRATRINSNDDGDDADQEIEGEVEGNKPKGRYILDGAS